MQLEEAADWKSAGHKQADIEAECHKGKSARV